MPADFCGAHLGSLFLLLLSDYVISLELVELRVPELVALGTRATLSCRWVLGPDVLYSVKWYKDGKEFFRYVPRDQTPRRTFLLPGVNVEESEMSGTNVVLSAAVPETGGRYRCEVSGERPLFPTVSRHGDIKVAVLPERGPTITGLLSQYRVGDQMQIVCTSGPSRPSSNLSWYINGEPARTTALRPSFHTHEDHTESTTVGLKFILTEEHFKRNTIKVKCLATLGTLYWRSNEGTALLEKVGVDNIESALQETTTMTGANNCVHTVHTDCVRASGLRHYVNSIMVVIAMFILKCL